MFNSGVSVSHLVCVENAVYYHSKNKLNGTYVYRDDVHMYHLACSCYSTTQRGWHNWKLPQQF